MQLLSTLFISRFYKMNAGFFLFLFIILFGILPGADTIRLHSGIMQAATASLPSVIIAMVVLLLYNFKCISFVSRELEKPENGFLYNLQGLNNSSQIASFLNTHIALYFPLLLYGLITVVVGFNAGHYTGSPVLLLWLLLMVIGGAYTFFHKINATWRSPLLALPAFTLFSKKGFFSYLLHYSLGNKKGAFIGIKIFSLLALQFLVALNADKASKENVCFLILLCISAHALLPVYYVQFIEGELAFLRNLPLSLMKRFGVFVFTYSVIFIPELLFLLWNEHSVLSIQMIMSLYILAIVRLTLYTTLQYLKNMDVNRYTGVVFVMFFVTLILLASFNLWLFIIAEAVVAACLFYLLYYKYENINTAL